MKQANPSGWSAVEAYAADGRIHFEQSARLPAAAVDQSEDGAHELAERYWREVEAPTFRLVRTRRHCEGLDLRLLGR